VYFFVPLPQEIKNEIEIVSSAEMGKKSPPVVLALENKFEEFRDGFEMVVFPSIPYAQHNQIPPIVRFNIPCGVFERRATG